MCQINIFESQFSINYYTSPQVFQQVNLETNKKLRLLINEIILTGKYKLDSILDLYCGSGNLSLYLAKREKVVIIHFLRKLTGQISGKMAENLLKATCCDRSVALVIVQRLFCIN